MGYLIGVGVVLGYLVLERGGVYSFDWSVGLLALGVMAMFVAKRGDQGVARGPGGPPHRVGWWALLPVYVALQMLVSVTPATTLDHFLRICGYVAFFLVVREVSARMPEKPWAVAVPLVAIAALEAVLGLVQFYGATDGGMAHGTYVNRNHYAGLLEMALPFAAMYPVAVLRRTHERHSSAAAPAVKACIGWAVAALILVGIVHSLSRMGFVACLGSVAIMGALASGRWAVGGGQWATPPKIVAVVAVVVALFIFLPPDQLIERFAGLASSEEISAESRHQIWGETLSLVKAHPVAGTGLGSYESAFLKYKKVAPMMTVDFAHNDYLQLLAELGIGGFGIVLVYLGFMVRNIAGLIGMGEEYDMQCLGIACAGSLGAILLHSTADFNLYIPANAAVLAWVGGVTAGVRSEE